MSEYDEILKRMGRMNSGGTTEPAQLVRIKGWEWDHEVRVHLPPSYHYDSNRAYPTLWVTDNALAVVEAATIGAGTVGDVPELIVVAIGPPQGTLLMEFQRRRVYDFLPDASLMGAQFAALENMGMKMGGAPAFLDYLVNQLRPQLARTYRMRPDDHGYAGHSGGGQFGLYTLFNRPESFNRYLISSPAAYQPWLDMEERWHQNNQDLKARVFLSAGELEVSIAAQARAQIASSVVLMAERLATRSYPSLELTTRIFPGEDHLTVLPVAYTHGVRRLWRN